MKPSKIYIITDAPIPVGFASTNRILSYVNGFTENNILSEVIVFRKTQAVGSEYNNKNKGNIYGGKYKYLHKSTKKSSSFLKRRFDNFISPFLLFFYSLSKIENNTTIIYYSTQTAPLILLYLTTFLKRNVILLKEESEHPAIYIRKMSYLNKILFSHLHYYLFDGFLIMTKPLLEVINELYPKKPKKLVPMTVIMSRFNKEGIQKEKMITYTGSLNNKKDGVLNLIKAFKKFNDINKEYKLLICGFSSCNKEKELLLNKIFELNLTKKVIFEENISNSDIPTKLMNSAILVLPRPDSIQAQNGFPTKLGEYLATAVPVVVTKVGEISNYLKHQKSAYIIEPGDIESLFTSFVFIVNNYESAIVVGENGRKVALDKFNSIKQAESIINFIREY